MSRVPSQVDRDALTARPHPEWWVSTPRARPGHGGVETEALPVQAGHRVNPAHPGKRLGWGAPCSLGRRWGAAVLISWPFSGWRAGGQGREGGQTQGQCSRREGGVKGERGLSAPLAPSPLQMTGPRRSGSGWSGPASSLPSFPAGRQNCSPGTAFFFIII